MVGHKNKKIASYDKIGKWEDTGGHKWGLDHWGTDDDISDWKPDFGGGDANDYGDQPEDEGGSVWFPLWAPFMASGYGLGSDPMGDQITTIVSVTTTTSGGETTVDITSTAYDSAGNPIAQDSTSTPVSDEGTSDSGGATVQNNEEPDNGADRGFGGEDPSDTIEVTGDRDLPTWVPDRNETGGEGMHWPRGDKGDSYADWRDELTVIVEGNPASTFIPDDVYTPDNKEESTDETPRPSDAELLDRKNTVIVVGDNWPDLMTQLLATNITNNIKEHLHMVDAWDVETVYVYANPATPAPILKMLNEIFLTDWRHEGGPPNYGFPHDHWKECDAALNSITKLEAGTTDKDQLAMLEELWDQYADMECHSYMPIWNVYNKPPF